MKDEITIFCADTPTDVLKVEVQDGGAKLFLTYEDLVEQDEYTIEGIKLDKQRARELFNYLGAWLVT